MTVTIIKGTQNLQVKNELLKLYHRHTPIKSY